METYTIEFPPFLALNFFADSVVQKGFPEKREPLIKNKNENNEITITHSLVEFVEYD